MNKFRENLFYLRTWSVLGGFKNRIKRRGISVGVKNSTDISNRGKKK